MPSPGPEGEVGLSQAVIADVPPTDHGPREDRGDGAERRAEGTHGTRTGGRRRRQVRPVGDTVRPVAARLANPRGRGRRRC